MKARVDFEVPLGARVSNCSSCGAGIVWMAVGEHSDGRPKPMMPLDLRSMQRGLDGVDRAESHFAHCPNAEQHRRKR